MAVTVNVYDQAATVFAQGLANIDGTNNGLGAISAGDTYATFKVALFNNFPDTKFVSTHTVFSDLAANGSTEITTNGVPAGGVIITNPEIVTTGGNDAYFDADDFTVTASGGDITANYGVLYRTATTEDNVDRLLLHIDFGQEETAANTTQFKIVWSASGIFSFVVA